MKGKESISITSEKYSFSRLTTYHQCPHSYYLTYVKNPSTPRHDNIYSFMGSEVHELLEKMQQEIISNDEAKEIFLEKLAEADMIGHKFMTDNTKKKFTENLLRYFESYKPIKGVESYIEEYFELDIEGITMRGYIDLYTITDDKYIDIYDYKTSSKFSKKDLEIKKLQLIIYAIALREKYPNHIIRGLYFDMLKYTFNKRGTLKERIEVNDTDRALLEIEFNDETEEQARNFIKNTYNEIKSDIFFEPKIEKFFCKNICSNYRYCEKAKKEVK